MLLVTGATGQFGAKTMDALLAKLPAQRLAVSVRDPAKAAALRARGVDIRHGNFNDPSTLDAAFRGVSRILIISTSGDWDNAIRIRQHLAAVNAAKATGVKFIAYTSIAKADYSSIPLAETHRATEAAIRATGIAFSFLRNNWYIENEFMAVRSALANAPVITATGEGKHGWAARQDYAEAAAEVLAGDGHENSIYELSGPPLSYAGLAKILSSVLDRYVALKQVNEDAYGKHLTDAGLPNPVVELLVGFQRPIREGALDILSDRLVALLKRPLTPLDSAIRSMMQEMSPPA